MTQIVRHPDPPTDSYAAARPAAKLTTGLAANQKKIMGITAATLLLGGGVGLLLARPKGSGPSGTESGADGPATTNEVLQPTTSLPADVDVAGKVTDTMSFEQAFEAARDEVGMGGVFNWHGRWYNTFEKEEWGSLSLEQRQEYVELITGEKLPVKPYHQQAATPTPEQNEAGSTVEPTIIEGYLNGQRIISLDVDRDGVIDTMVLEGTDGYTYRVVDETGNDGLDMLYRYDPLNGELIEMEKLDEPFVLTNDQFSQGLEASMSKEVVDSILESDVPATTTAPVDETETTGVPETNDSPDNDPIYIAEASTPDDTYINNGDVHDMEH